MANPETVTKLSLKRKHQFLLFTVPVMFMVYYLLYKPTRVEIHFDGLTTADHVIESGGGAGNNFFKVPSILGQMNILRGIHDYMEGATPKIQYKENVNRIVNEELEEALKDDKGTGCNIPKTDPFAEEILQFFVNRPLVNCTWKKRSWVKCHLSSCKVEPDILQSHTDIECSYRDIIASDDFSYYLGESQVFKGNQEFKFNVSDHVEISCTGLLKANGNAPLKVDQWKGHGVGFRPLHPKKPPPGREKTYNVLIFGFDSTSKNDFLRKMPKSFLFLKEQLNAVIYNGYHIVGEGTPAALFPLLTGRTEIELPECRYMGEIDNNRLDGMPFIFYKLTEDGYRTAYLEDMPWIGTFQFRFNGFSKQPADHYLRSLFTEVALDNKRNNIKRWTLCFNDILRFKLMMNLTDQFFQLDGKKFGFTFIADITHDINHLNSADDAFVDFMRELMRKNILKDTFLVVMGDHGNRFQNVRQTLQGKLEERLPIMAIRLPDSMKAQRPDAQAAVELNADVLTTPHDIHATLLDVMDMRQHWNDYKVKGADLTRGLTLLEPIPKNRSCSEAGIEPHWCVCIKWEEVAITDPLYNRTAQALVDQINFMTKFAKQQCARRTLTSISWVMRQQNNKDLVKYNGASDNDGFIAIHNGRATTDRKSYQVKIEVGPGKGMYEAVVTHLFKSDKLVINTREISRTNAYNDEPSCISASYPHINPYCYCIK